MSAASRADYLHALPTKTLAGENLQLCDLAASARSPCTGRFAPL
jgi:hypothetical protein